MKLTGRETWRLPVRVEHVIELTNTTRRFELTLCKPKFGWYPRPTVVVDGVAQPAQWGTRNWKIPGVDTVHVQVFLFNRGWKFGAAEFWVAPDVLRSFNYRAPRFPFGPGSIAERAAPNQQ